MLFENHWNVNGENESMEEVDMDGSESDQELTGNETDESVAPPQLWLVRTHILLTCTCIWKMSPIYMHKHKVQNV
jgi:hypothetical protein